MAIDKFINDYLDGTISQNDDQEFRELLENDISAQEEFDLMISLHTMLKEDAKSIVVPKTLEEKVEQRILASYLRMTSLKNTSKGKSLAYALAVFLLLFVFSISNIKEGTVVQNTSYFVSQILRQQDLLEHQVKALTEEPGTGPNSTQLNNFYANRISLKIESPENTSLKEIQQSSIEKRSISDISLEPLNTIAEVNQIILDPFSSEFIPINRKTVASSFKDNLILNFPTMETFGRSIHFKLPSNLQEKWANGIALSCFSSFPLMKFGYDQQNIKSFSSFSQSVGYQIGNNFRLGMEFGYFDFDYQKMTTILVPAIQAPAKEKKIFEAAIDKKNTDAVILTNGEDNTHPRYIQINVPINRRYQHYWGSLFVDYEYLVLNQMSLVGRINIGATSDGFLGGVVLLAEFQPISGISLNFGVENKTYWSSMPVDANSWKNILSLVYGVSVKFNLNN